MKNGKPSRVRSSARTSRVYVHHIEFREEVSVALIRLGRRYGLNSVGRVVAFVCGAAIMQQTIHPELPAVPDPEDPGDAWQRPA